MEYIEGADLRSYLRIADNLRTIPAIIDQLLAALAFLHESLVVHGDIKPENIMITGANALAQAKLLDFGLISSGSAIRGEKISGTPRFLAPELLNASANKSPATDLYALGATLCESIEDLEFPSPLEIADDILKNRYMGMSRMLSRAGVSNPSSIASFVLDLCDADPLQRPASTKTAKDSFMTKILSVNYDKEGAFNPAFAGRFRELDEISCFLRPKQTEQRILVLQGPRGAGKKSIIRKVTQAEQLKQRCIIDLSSIPYEYFSVTELVRIVSEQLPGRQLGVLPQETSAFQSSMHILEEAADSSAIAFRSIALMNKIVNSFHEIATHRATIIILPDIDRLCADYTQFLNQIVTHLDLGHSNIKIALSLNTDVHPSADIKKFVARLRASAFAAFLDVEGFSDEVLVEYFLGAFGEVLMSDNERSHLLGKTQGLPLLIEAAIRHLLSKRIIRLEDDKWVFDKALYARSDIPIASKGSFDLALADLEEDEKNLLALLAIYNREISYDRLAILAGHSIPSWEKATNALIAKAILSKRSQGAVSFAHPCYRENALAKCAAGNSMRLNRCIAEYLSTAEPNEVLRIARHYIAAEEIDKAMSLGHDIINNLCTVYMPIGCLQLFVDLRRLANDIGRREQFILANSWLAPIQHQTGLLKESIATYTTLIKEDNNNTNRARYMMKLAALRESLGDTGGAILSMRRALHFIRDHQLTDLLAECYMLLGQLSPKRSIYYLERALNVFGERESSMYLLTLSELCPKYKRLGNMKRLHNCENILKRGADRADVNIKKAIYGALASVHFLSGEYESQREYLEKKMKIEIMQDDTLGTIQSLNSLGGNYFTNGNYSALLQNLKHVYSLAISYNQLLTAVNASYNMILACRALGDYGQALAAIKQTERLIRERNISRIGPISYIKPVQLYALLGSTTEKEFTLRAQILRRSAVSISSAIGLGHYNMCYSTYHHINLRHKKALAFADKALAFFKKAEDRDDVVLALIQKSILLATLGEIKEAARSIKQAVKIYDEIHCEYLKPFLMLGRGMISRCAGDDDARALLAEGLRASKKMGTRENTWQIQRELALYHRDRNEYRKAIDYFQDAIETLKQITETLDEEELKISYLEVPSRKRIFDEIKDLKRRTQ